MDATIVKFKGWVFEVDKDLTQNTYQNLGHGGAEVCRCNDCKSYIAYREHVFSDAIKDLFQSLGVDYRKEVEIVSYEVQPGNLNHVGGWFHSKGKILSGKDCVVSLPAGGNTFDLTKITENLSIGFRQANDLTFFEDKKDLVQIEFETIIPIVD